jgi:hypothetical protein
MRFNPIGNEFAAVVEGIDLCAPLNSAQVAAINAGMDRHAVLVFHDQPVTDEQQIAFTRSLGKIELNTANNITRLDQRRLSVEMSDISNLDQTDELIRRRVSVLVAVGGEDTQSRYKWDRHCYRGVCYLPVGKHGEPVTETSELIKLVGAAR